MCVFKTWALFFAFLPLRFWCCHPHTRYTKICPASWSPKWHNDSYIWIWYSWFAYSIQQQAHLDSLRSICAFCEAFFRLLHARSTLGSWNQKPQTMLPLIRASGCFSNQGSGALKLSWPTKMYQSSISQSLDFLWLLPKELYHGSKPSLQFTKVGNVHTYASQFQFTTTLNFHFNLNLNLLSITF